MKPEEVLEKIKENLKNKKELSKEDFRKNIQEIFIKFMGYENNTQIVYDDKSEKLYTCIIDTKIIIGAYRKETRIRALNLFSTYIKSKYEWGILFTQKESGYLMMILNSEMMNLNQTRLYSKCRLIRGGMRIILNI